MIRRNVFAAVAVACCVAVVGSAFAQAGGGAKATVPVRIKNVGQSSVRVNAASGAGLSAAALKSGSKTVSRNGVAQFLVRKGNFTAVAANPSNYNGVNSVRGFSTGNFKTYYLQAQATNTAASIVGAPPGVKF
ncbi:MAG: hypothetical protein DWI03_11280 [Planctomycetota bacterium]|nr:MAG: hypothetical protein DWI03_11280 [Planctomycetota bacterium]